MKWSYEFIVFMNSEVHLWSYEFRVHMNSYDHSYASEVIYEMIIELMSIWIHVYEFIYIDSEFRIPDLYMNS